MGTEFFNGTAVVWDKDSPVVKVQDEGTTIRPWPGCEMALVFEPEDAKRWLREALDRLGA